MALALATLFGVLASADCDAAKLSKQFPELAHRKASLDSIALLVDAVIVEDVFGNVENVHLQESRDYAERVLKQFAEELKRKRYTVRQRATLSLGGSVSPSRPFRCSDKVVPAHTDASGFYVAASADTSARFAPFWADSSAIADPEALAGWQSLLRTARQPVRADSIPSLPAAIALGARLQCDAIVIASLVSWTEGMGKWATKAAAVALASGSVMSGVFATPESGGVSVGLAIYDTTDGRLLWADVRPLVHLSPENLKFRVPEMTAELP